MCSFLHVFLGFTILFTFIKDSITQYDYEKESAQRQSQSQTQLVFAQEGLDQFDQTCLEEDLENFKPASQQGLFFPYPDQQSHEFERGRSERCLLPVEMQLRTYQQEMGDNMCNLLGKVDRWHSSPHSAKESRSPRVECIHVGRLGRQCELGIKSIDQPDVYKVSAGWRWPAWPTEALQERQRERTGEGEERSYKGIVSEQRQPSGACFTLPARGELCSLDTYGHFSVWIHLGATCEPICQPDASHFEQRETGISRPSSESLSRSEYNARRNKTVHRQNRTGNRKNGNQELTPSYQAFGEGQETPWRSCRPAKGTQIPMDGPSRKRHQALGEATRRLSETSGHVDRTGGQGQIRSHGNKSNHPTIEQCDSRRISSSPTAADRGGGSTRRSGGQGGGSSEETASGNPPKLCKLVGIGVRPTKGCGDSRYRGCGGRHTASKAAKGFGAIWTVIQAVIVGRVNEVQRNSLHEACTVQPNASIVEAYQIASEPFGAACDWWGDLSRYLLPWKHSIMDEIRYISPFQASLNALNLQWEVGFDLLCSQPFYHNPAQLISALRTPAPSQRSYSKNFVQRSVRFEDQIDVLLGDDDDIEMSCLQVAQIALVNWPEKPWSGRRIRKINHHPTTSQAPLSQVAVLSRDEEIDVEITSFVQTIQSKHDIYNGNEANLMDAISSGQTGTAHIPIANQEGDTSISDSASEEGPSSVASSGIRPPSSTNERQEVIMFHIHDPPLRAFLDWSSYDNMINEIAGHYATIVENVVDAYEINADLQGIPPDAVPIIVHLFPDTAVAHTAKLVLFDLELHAHNSEPGFRLGPKTQRFVLPVPEWIDRASVLTLANSDVYCQMEGDRCFVWHGNQRWQDTDLHARRIAHGDYFRVALPPTERFTCTTQQIVEWTQNGLSDTDILHRLAGHEGNEGYSPSLLDEEEVRQLATVNIEVEDPDADHFSTFQIPSDGSTTTFKQPLQDVTNIFHDVSKLQVGSHTEKDEGDLFLAMQNPLREEAHNHEVDTLSSSGSSGDRHLQEWNLDLQRLVQQHVNGCTPNRPEEEELLFSVYTWFIDHQSGFACFQPRIAFLGGDPAEWREDLTHPWRYQVIPDEPLFIDVVSHFTPRAEIEEHIAHVLLSQRAQERRSTLVSLEFLAPVAPSVIVRCAVAVPNPCTRHDIGYLFPLFARISDESLVWQHPEAHQLTPQFGTWNGMGIILQVLPEQEVMQDAPPQDLNSLVQVDASKKRVQVDVVPEPACSFTDEFLEAISAAEEAARMEPPVFRGPNELAMANLPEAFRTLSDRFAEEVITTPAQMSPTRRIESWFLDHASFTRCHSSRISLLSADVLTWRHVILDTWRDRISDAEQIDFHVVDPTPEDAAIGTIGQLIVTQRASSELRSIVLSVYDSDPDMERSPYTFAFVLHRRVNLERLLAALQLTSDCPPVNRHNHCSLWFGRLPIDDALVVNVHMGQAFRLVIGRGIAIDIAHLLQMDDVMLRDTLQRSASTEIYMRPNEPDFLHPDNAAFPSQLPFVIPDGRPGWIPVLQQHFDRLHWRDSLDAGPYLVVFVWYLNAHPHFHCGAPHLIRISDDPLVWRAELMTSWRDHLLRASPADFFVLPGVLTGTPAAQQEEHSTVAQEVHVLVHQALPIDVHGVLITLRGVASLQVLTRRFAHVLRSREAVSAILRLVVPNEHSHRPAMVQYEGCTYLPGEQLLLHTGSHLVVEISPHAIDLYSDQIAEDVEDVNLFQQVVTCKPAEFQEPDDFPVSLPTSNLPRRARPKHDGEFEWSIQFGHLMQLHGDLDPWSDTLSMEVTTWYVDHLRAPICHQPRNMRMSGHAITWIEDLRHLWADRLDPNREFSIYLVQPRPPHFRVQRSTCHFLLEQGKTPGHEALVLTALLEGYTNEGIIQGAFSIGSRTHLADVIRTMEIAHFCAGRRCTIIQFPHLLIEDQWFDVASGQSLRVRIEPQEERQEDFDIDTVPFEDLSLMQTAGCFQFNPQAAPFIPGQTPIQMQPEVIQDLHAVWAIATSQQAATSKAAVFSTWFVSPGTGRSRCQFSRRATLFDDFLQWFEILRQTWHDLLDPGVPFQVVLVQPAPEPMESGVVGHVILIQHPFDTMSALLVTVKDVAINVGHPNRIVVNVPENIAKRDLLQSVGYERDCHLKGASCQIRHALAAWDAQVLWPVRDGDCFYVQITRAFLPAEWHPPLPFQELGSDGLGLLQVHSRTVKQPSEHPRKGHRMRSERSPSHVLLIAWFVDENHPVCRMPKIKEVDSSACLVKQAEQLWIDTLGGRECQVFTVETMSRCVQSGSELDEVCFVIDGRTLPINADAEVAIVLERVLVAGNQHLVEHFAALVEPPSCAKQLWKHLLGRSGDPIPEATTCYLQGRNWDLNMVAHNLAPGSCVSFWLEQDKLAEKFVRITFKQVIIAFEWLDAHFFLPCYDLPVTFPFLPICYDWTNEWWEPNAGGTHVSIYFDGSYISNAEGTRAGAAAAAFVCVKGKWMFAGALSTALSNAKNSYQAETSASIIAMKFAYGILKLIGAVQNTALVDVHLCYDSLTVGKQSAGEWHAVPSPTVGHLLRSLHKCVQRRFRSELKYHHVKAHCGEPGNELVDTLAHQAALGAPLQDLEPWIAHVTARAFVSNAEWFWFLFRDDVSWDLNDLLLPAAPSTLPDTLHDSPPPILAQDCEQVGELMLTLTTCNVLTLVSCKKKGSQAFQGPARQESVFQQMADEQIHIFALQETRLKRLSNAHDSRFWLYRSAATSGGHYGVLIGLTRDRPVGFLHKDGVAKKVYIEQQDVAVIAVDPRYLILRLKTSLFKVILIAGHAPHTGSAQTEIDAWWSTVASRIPTKYGTWPRILLCDANARVGAEPCPHIGPFQAEKGNGKEEGFIQFVRQQGIFLPSTFETCHVGDGGTWLHNNGAWCRNDFVGLPAEWTYDSCKSWVSTVIDVGLHKEDHRAPVVTFKRQAVVKDLKARTKPFKMNLPPLRPEHLPELPTYAWHLDVHTHAHQIQQDLINSLWDVQVKPGGVPRKTTMSTETWDIVCQKRHARNALASHQKAQRQTVLAAWFACWRHSLVDGFPSNLLVTFDELLCQQDSLIAVAYHRFRALGRLVVKRLRQDDVTFFDNLLQDCTEYLGPAQVKQLWKTIRRSLPRFQQRRMTTPPFQLEDQWVNHFSQLEAGTPTSMPQLLRMCVTRDVCSV